MKITHLIQQSKEIYSKIVTFHWIGKAKKSKKAAFNVTRALEFFKSKQTPINSHILTPRNISHNCRKLWWTRLKDRRTDSPAFLSSSHHFLLLSLAPVTDSGAIVQLSDWQGDKPATEEEKGKICCVQFSKCQNQIWNPQITYKYHPLLRPLFFYQLPPFSYLGHTVPKNSTDILFLMVFHVSFSLSLAGISFPKGNILAQKNALLHPPAYTLYRYLDLTL